MVDSWYVLTKGPFSAVSRLTTVTAILVGVCGLLAAFIPIVLPIAVLLGSGFAAVMLMVLILLMCRLHARTRDLQAAVTLFANVSQTNDVAGGLFVEGAAANACLMLFLYKCLVMVRPRKVLELGSGQTTKILAHYFHESPGVEIVTLEHTEQWMSLLKPQLTRDGKCHDYRHSPLVARDFTCSGIGKRVRTLAYSFESGEKYDLILVDGPDSGPGVGYTRHGFLEHVPKILDDRFVVIFDDAERFDERQLTHTFGRILRANNIAFVRFEIEATKTQTVFCSPQLAFLRSV